jgi:type VI secretion system protein ImpK
MTLLSSLRDRSEPTISGRNDDHLERSDRSSGNGMRDLLRDTALLVTSLGEGGRVPDAAAFRERCRQIIATFSEALTRRGYSDQVRQEALVAQCGLLDETALCHLDAESRSKWELKPLQVEWFKVHDAGEQVIERAEARVRETPANVDLIDCYAAILGMGFMGRYAIDDGTQRADLLAALNARLEKLRPAAQPFITEQGRRRLSDWFYRLSPWAIAGLACIVAVLVWSAGRVALDAQIARITHGTSAKVTQPVAQP